MDFQWCTIFDPWKIGRAAGLFSASKRRHINAKLAIFHLGTNLCYLNRINTG